MDNNQENKFPDTIEQNADKMRLKKQKKTIIIVFLCLIGFIALYFAGYFISSLFPKYTVDEYDIFFYDESYSAGDITKDEIYMSKNRIINFYKESTGVTVSILENEKENYNQAVNLLYSMVEFMIDGNVEGYNGCFSQIYFSTEEPRIRFTKQKIYNITITEVSITEKKDENGESYTEYYYKLDYMIRHNNGTLRNDVGSDAIKTQHVYLSDKTGEVLIDKLIVYTSVSKK